MLLMGVELEPFKVLSLVAISLAGHADPGTTRLYDRRQKRITRNIVERISI